MSLTGILDTDREILRYVEDKRLLKVCCINKRMWNTVCDEAFLRRRLNKYFEIEKYRKGEDLKRFFCKVAYYVSEMKDNFEFTYTGGDFEKQCGLLREFKTDNLLIASCKYGELSLVKYCFNRGISVSVQNDEALIQAVQGKHLEIIKYLVENGADIHIWDDYPIESAIDNNCLEMLQYFFSKGCNIHMNAELALRHSARRGYLEMVKWLIERGCNIHIQEDYPLRLASKGGHFDVVKFLISAGANVHAKKNYALKQAEKGGFSEIVDYLKISRDEMRVVNFYKYDEKDEKKDVIGKGRIFFFNLIILICIILIIEIF